MQYPNQSNLQYAPILNTEPYAASYNQQYGQQYDQQYDEACPACPSCADSSSGFGGIQSPMGFIKDKAICLLIGLALFAIILFLISKIPLIGPKVKSTLLWLLTKLMIFAGIANCGYQNDFDDVLKAET